MSVTESAHAEAAQYAMRPRAVRVSAPLLAVLFLLVVAALSIALGARRLALVEIWPGLTDPHAPAYAVVHQLRLPRTLLGLLAGTALGLAGGITQTLTRNPLADPGLLGINAGAASAVVSAITFLGVTTFTGYIWFAFVGAAAVSVLVWAVGGGRTATPTRIVLAGTAANAVMYAYVNAVQLLNTNTLDKMRFWTVGSLASARPGTIAEMAPFIAAGIIAAALLARPLNALALGEESARSLGSRPALTRAGAIIAMTLLCGAATAACGPIVFIGLMVPHIVRPLTGPDLRRMLPYCAVLAPAILLGADVLGRLLARPGEVLVGIVTAVVGGPFFLYAVRRGRWARG